MGNVVRRTSTMQQKSNGASNNTDADKPEDADKTETATSPSGSPASPDSAAAKANKTNKRTRKAKKSKSAKKVKVTDNDLVYVGEIVKIAFNEGDDPIEPAELVETWRARIAAWDKVHGVEPK